MTKLTYKQSEYWGKVIDFKEEQTYSNIKLGLRVYKIHILKLVEGMIVYRFWSKEKQYWIYKIEDPICLTGIVERE